MTIGEKIKQFRKLKNLTQKELAERANISTGTLQQYELGTRTPKSTNLKNVADILGITVDEILSDKSPVKADDSIANELTAKTKNNTNYIIIAGYSGSRHTVELTDEELEQVNILLEVMREKKKREK